LEDYVNRKQEIIPSEVMGGIIAEEARKILMPLDEKEFPVERLAYSLASSKRFSAGKEFEVTKADLKDKKILVVGAGALGNFVALGLALQGAGYVDIMDYDTVESTNLNRQILFYDSVGQKKAESLVSKMTLINPAVLVRGLVAKLDEKSDYFVNNRPDLIMDCVDSFAVRAIINYFAVRNEIPLISGGTNPKSGQVVVYKPGESSCLDCKLGVEKALAEQRKAASCRYAPDPSVIMTNQIIGGMMVGEAVKTLTNDYGEPVRRILKYDSKSPLRGGLVGSEEICYCKKPDVSEWLKQVDNKK